MVRQGLKDYANWPTYPQIWVNGKLVGGVDILQELKDTGELASVLPPALDSSALTPPSTLETSPSATATATTVVSGTASTAAASTSAAVELTPALRERLQALVSKAPVMLFMKGTPAQPRCGFSKRVVQLLDEHGIQYETFDILEDEEVRGQW